MSGRNLDKTIGRILQIWWAFAWRVSVISLSSGVFVGFMTGLLASGLGYETRAVAFWIQVSVFVVGVPIGILVMRAILFKQYSSFRIELVELEPNIREGESVSDHVDGIEKESH